MQCTDLRADLRLRLGRTVVVSAADEPLSQELLTPGERVRASSLRRGRVLDDWLRGRAALRALGAADTAELEFPHPTLSVTHAGSRAFAVAAKSGVAGIGVDFEPWKPSVSPRMAAFFLCAGEQQAAVDAIAMIRLWTVKEALFKAFPDNRDCVLLDFVLADAGADCGTATAPDGRTLLYASAEVRRGCLSVAVTPEGGEHVSV